MANPTTNETVHTTETSLEIIDTLQKVDKGRIDEFSELLDMSPSTIHRHLQTLRKDGYVVKEGDFYQLGLQFLTIGGHIRNKRGEYDLAKEAVEKLAKKTQERAQFEVEEQGERIFIHTAIGEQAVQADGTIGRRGPLYCSAAGKAILAALPDSRIDVILEEQNLEKVTEKTITSSDSLHQEIKQIRKEGVSFSREESTIGLHAVGASVQLPNGEVLGALSVSGPAHRMQGELFTEQIPNTVRGMAQELELNIKYSKTV